MEGSSKVNLPTHHLLPYVHTHFPKFPTGERRKVCYDVPSYTHPKDSLAYISILAPPCNYYTNGEGEKVESALLRKAWKRARESEREMITMRMDGVNQLGM